MAGDLGTAVLNIEVRLDALERGLAEAENKSAQGGSLAGDAFSTAIGVGIARAGEFIISSIGNAIHSAIDFGVTGFESLMRIERIMAQTETVIRSTGGAAGLTATQIADMAGAMEDLTATEAESTQQAANLLLTFTGIGEDTFPAALQATLDMARALDKTGEASIDMSGQALMIGKALQDPILGMTALRRVGVNFNESAQETVAHMVEMGDVAGAQKFILDELATEFGGSAEAFAQTTAGQLELVKHQVGTLQETLAGPFLDIAGDVFGRLNEIIRDPAVAEAIERIGEAIATFLSGALERLFVIVEIGFEVFSRFFSQIATGEDPIGAIANLVWGLAGAFGMGEEQAKALFDSIIGLRGTISTLIETVSGVLGPIFNAVTSFVSLKDVLIGVGLIILSAVIPAIVGVIVAALPIIATVGAIIGIVALLRNAWENNWGGIQEKVAAVIAFVTPIFNSITEWLAVAIPRAVVFLKDAWENVLLPAIQGVWSWIQDTLIPFFQNTVVPILQDVIPQAIETMSRAWEGIRTVVGAVFEAIIAVVGPVVEQIITTFAGIGEQVAPIWEALKSLFEQIGPFLVTIGAVIGGIVVGIVGLVVGIFSGIGNALGPFIETVSGVITAIVGIFEGVITTVGGFFEIIIGLFTGNHERIAAGWEAMKEGVLGIIVSFAEGVGALVSGLVATVVAFISGLVEGVVGFFTNLYERLVGGSIIPDMITDIVAAIAGLVGDVLRWFGDLITDALKLFAGWASDLLTWLSGMAFDFLFGIGEFVNDVLEWFVGLVTNVLAIFTETDWIQLGVDVITGILNGLASAGNRIIDFIVGLASDALQGIKNFFGIESPSKVMFDVGVDIIQGLVDGVKATRGLLLDEMNQLAKDAKMTVTMDTGIAGTGLSWQETNVPWLFQNPGGPATGGGGMVIYGGVQIYPSGDMTLMEELLAMQPT